MISSMAVAFGFGAGIERRRKFAFLSRMEPEARAVQA